MIPVEEKPCLDTYSHMLVLIEVQVKCAEKEVKRCKNKKDIKHLKSYITRKCTEIKMVQKKINMMETKK